ncbi:MAG: lipid A export permease/ATP-binding protein MsbA [Opitutales bacterium]
MRPVLPQFILAVIAGIFYGISTGLGIPTVVKWIYPKIFDNDTIQLSTLILICTIPTLIAIIRGLSSFTNSYLVGYCGQFLLCKLSIRVFEKIQNLPLAFFNKNRPGELIARATSDTGLLQTSLVEFAQEILKQPTTLIGAAASLTYLCIERSDIAFLLIFILAIPICIVPIRFTGKKLRSKAWKMQHQIGELTQNLTQNLGAVREIRAFCLENRELKRYSDTFEEFSRRFLKVIKYNVILTPMIEVVAAFGVGMALFYAFQNRIPADDFIATVITLYLCYEPIKKLGRLHNKVHEGLAGLERIETLLNEPIDIQDPENPVDVGTLQGNITFTDISFAYEATPVLHGVNESLQAGKTYALVGPSGAGKTTFANLIPRFYEACTGDITIDGINIRSMRLHDLRHHISIVSQDPVLFNDTVYNNILVGNPDADKAEVLNAAKNAYADRFIEELEDGYETMVGERGTRLSGGQKQRIAIARAFLKNAPILILDEATSALDANSERFIQQALETLIRNKTVILIAHRFSSIKHADEILLFDKGKIIDRGPHEVLFANSELYQSLYKNQVQ